MHVGMRKTWSAGYALAALALSGVVSAQSSDSGIYDPAKTAPYLVAPASTPYAGPMTAAATAAASIVSATVNNSPAGPLAGLNYSSGRLTVDYQGFLFCNSFGVQQPNTSASFFPKHGTFYTSPFAIPGLTTFVYAPWPGGTYRARVTLCPIDDSFGENPLLCSDVRNVCLYADETGTGRTDSNSLFRSSFEDRSRGSYVTVTNFVRPTVSNSVTQIAVSYIIPGTNQGTPAQSYVSSFSFETAKLSCPVAGTETFYASTATQTITRTYTCGLLTPGTLPASGTPLFAVMLFPQPGTSSYRPAPDSASDNLVIVKM